jgi:hypothetical protein
MRGVVSNGEAMSTLDVSVAGPGARLRNRDGRSGRRGRRICTLLATFALLASAAPAHAASLDQVEVSPTGSWPALARNVSSNEFFVVWSSEGDVVGRRLDGRGRPLGPAVTLASDGAIAAAAVAYSPARREFLVVWTRRRTVGVMPEVRAQRVSRWGRTIGSSSVVDDLLLDPASIAVAYNAVADRYVVAWVDGDSVLRWVPIRQLSGTGAVLADGDGIAFGCSVSAAAADRAARWLVTLGGACHGRSFLDGIIGVSVGVDGPLAIHDISDSTLMPGGRAGVAFNPQLQEFMTAFQVGASPPDAWWCPPTGCRPPGVYGQRLTVDGVEVGQDDFPILQWDSTRRPLGRHVAVAYEPRSRHYLVAWEQPVGGADSSAMEIFGRRLARDGTPVARPPFQISTMDDTEAQATDAVIAPARSQRYLVAWASATGGVFARMVRTRGQVHAEPLG